MVLGPSLLSEDQVAQIQDPNNVDFVGKDDRSNAWTITSDRWLAADAYIILPINPESLEVSLKILSSEVAMKGNKFMTVQRWSRTGSTFDFPIIQFKFNSGNIQPVFNQSFKQKVWQYANANFVTGFSSVGVMKPGDNQVGDHIYGRYKTVKVSSALGAPTGLYGGNTKIPVGVQNLYALLALMNDRWITTRAEPGFNGESQNFSVANRIIVNTNSLAFPNLTLYGLFEESGLQWSESADNFNNFETTFSLWVTDSNPSITTPNLDAMITAYKNGMYRSTARYDSFVPPSASRTATPTNNVADREYAGDKAAPSLSAADWIRQQVAGLTSQAGAKVDAVAEAAKRRVDEQYKQRAESEYAATLLARMNGVQISDIETSNNTPST